jgi:peptidoglycan hydrolase-like protein with peptidoglycan-binding domain
MTTPMIDISSWQHTDNQPIDWAAVKKAGYQGAIIKATQSTNYTNPWFLRDVEGAAEQGILVGAYHYAQPGGPSADDQAAYFHSVAAAAKCTLGYWLDLEETDGKPWAEIGAWAVQWVDALSTPVTPAGVYVNQSFWANIGYLLGAVRLWLVTVDGQSVPENASPVMVQTGKTTIGGIVGLVDTDTWLNPRALNLPTGPTGTPGTPGAPAVWAGTPPVQEGSTGPDVQWVQGRLNAWGDHLTVDGLYGELTAAAVAIFQEALSVTVDKVVGPVTYTKLALTPERDVFAPAVEPSEPEIKVGAEGDTVRLLQARLTAHGIPTADDGIFGPVTEANVRSFQAVAGVTVDGIVGPDTWHSLLY